MAWSLKDVPELTGKYVVVTGGNSGIGLEMVKVMARRGASVIMTSRDLARGGSALEGIKKCGVETGKVQVGQMDLTSLASIKQFAADVAEKH